MRARLGVCRQILHDAVVHKFDGRHGLEERQAIFGQRLANNKGSPTAQQFFQISLHRVHRGEVDVATERKEADVATGGIQDWKFAPPYAESPE